MRCRWLNGKALAAWCSACLFNFRHAHADARTTHAASAGEQVLRLLVQLNARPALIASSSSEDGPEEEHVASTPAATAAACAPPLLRRPELLSILRSSAGLAEHVLRFAPTQPRLTSADGEAVETLRLAARAPRLTLALKYTLPPNLDAAGAARVTRLELRDVTLTKDDLDTLAPLLTGLEELALVRCRLGDIVLARRQQPVGFAPTVRSLEVTRCRLSRHDVANVVWAAALLLRDPAALRTLRTDAPAQAAAQALAVFRGLTRLALRDCSELRDLRPLLAHAGLTHVELRRYVCTEGLKGRSPKVRDDFWWEELLLEDLNVSNLIYLPREVDAAQDRPRGAAAPLCAQVLSCREGLAGMGDAAGRRRGGGHGAGVRARPQGPVRDRQRRVALQAGQCGGRLPPVGGRVVLQL